ncbi:hypothetical protein TcCL_NonESM10393 [Trypanosoma cruzi]|nr:hypothetical protein TcCL_NonESM10393 [Trypanosoma cruzi]
MGWRCERVCGAGRSHWHILNKLCYGHPSPIQRALGPAVAHHRRMWTWLLPEASVARGEGSRLRCHDGNGVLLPSDTAGAPQEAEKERDLPDIDYVAADGVTSVVGQSLGDEAVSDKAGGGATATGPKGPGAADDAQGAVDPPPREDDAAVVHGGWEADMKDAPPPIHGSNTAAAACPFPLLLLLAAAAAVPTLSSGCKRERPTSTGMFLSVYTYTLLVCILCTRDMLYALSLFCVGR